MNRRREDIEAIRAALPLRVLQLLHRLSRESGIPETEIIDQALELWERLLEQPKPKTDEELLSIVNDPLRREIYTQVKSAESTLALRGWTKKRWKELHVMGGEARKRKLTPKRRLEIAIQAARARWASQKKPEK